MIFKLKTVANHYDLRDEDYVKILINLGFKIDRVDPTESYMNFHFVKRTDEIDINVETLEDLISLSKKVDRRIIFDLSDHELLIYDDYLE